MSARITVTVPASRYADHDDCLAAAARDYVADHPALRGYDLDPSWVGGEDGEREEIALSVPAWEAAKALAREVSARWPSLDHGDGALHVIATSALETDPATSADDVAKIARDAEVAS